MAKKLRTVRASSTDRVDLGAYTSLIKKYWEPYLPELLLKQAEEAMGEGRDAQKAREDILNRLMGRPAEQIKQDGNLSITINIKSVDSIEADDEGNKLSSIEPMEIKILAPPEGAMKEEKQELEIIEGVIIPQIRLA